MKKSLLIILLSLCALSIKAQSDVFEGYYAQAQQFAHDFPQERAYLHFDNTSYYQGDTIWFKAYLVDQHNQPSRISRPLYVELVDQLGNVMQKQIIAINNGEGSGFLSLAKAFFTGYYEIRAYTKWMMAFTQPEYFSRTFPVYRKKLSENEPRSIANYQMDSSMRQRPKNNLKSLTVRFFPEGGRLVKGLTSVVGIETVSKDSGWVNIEGELQAADGTVLGAVRTIHDGMGVLSYQPGEKPARVVMHFNGKDYKVSLPDAEPEGYVMTVSNRLEVIDVMVHRSQQASDSLALFLYSQGMPCAMVPLKFTGQEARLVRFRKSDLPEGLARLNLVDTRGKIVAGRLCFVSPRDTLSLKASTNQTFISPYAPVHAKLHLTDAAGKPVKGANVSVSVRDALGSDYLAFDNNIQTDLLLTSGLRGYIRRPGYYFSAHNATVNKLLDNLLIIRGWQNYDGTESILQPAPTLLPETQLMLRGHVEAFMRGTQSGLGVSIMARRDTVMLSGTTVTDSVGNFSVPLEDFGGTMDAIIQTRMDGKKRNRETDVMLDRVLDVPLRTLDYDELHPQWVNATDTTALKKAEDEEVTDSTALQLDGITVTARSNRRNLQQRTESFERKIVGYYNIQQYVDRLRDEGKVVPKDYGYLLHTLNSLISIDGSHYGPDSMRYNVEGKDIFKDFFNGHIDKIETALLYYDYTGNIAQSYDARNYRLKEDASKNFGSEIRTDTNSWTGKSHIFVRVDMTMRERWNPEHDNSAAHGMRHTVIQGYQLPTKFYAPVYPEGTDFDATDDRRRTLYWNPQMTTDENGDIDVSCYNGKNFTSVSIDAQTVVDGKPVAVQVFSSPTN